MSHPSDDSLLREQAEYYRARASEYDDWWYRRGRYDRGAEINAAWHHDTAELSAALDAFKPNGRVLEIACGTGNWTERLVTRADSVLALDVSPEMLAINRTKVNSPKVQYAVADIFNWHPTEKYDAVFFGFWLSHVPESRFESFWAMVGESLAPGGRVFFADSLRDNGSMAVNHEPPPENSTISLRKLDDGREFKVCKVFYDPAELTERLSRLGWNFEISRTKQFFLYGSGSRRVNDPT